MCIIGEKKKKEDLAEEIARVIGYDNIARNEINIPKGKISNIYDILLHCCRC